MTRRSLQCRRLRQSVYVFDVFRLGSRQDHVDNPDTQHGFGLGEA